MNKILDANPRPLDTQHLYRHYEDNENSGNIGKQHGVIMNHPPSESKQHVTGTSMSTENVRPAKSIDTKHYSHHPSGDLLMSPVKSFHKDDFNKCSPEYISKWQTVSSSNHENNTSMESSQSMGASSDVYRNENFHYKTMHDSSGHFPYLLDRRSNSIDIKNGHIEQINEEMYRKRSVSDGFQYRNRYKIKSKKSSIPYSAHINDQRSKTDYKSHESIGNVQYDIKIKEEPDVQDNMQIHVSNVVEELDHKKDAAVNPLTRDKKDQTLNLCRGNHEHSIAHKVQKRADVDQEEPVNLTKHDKKEELRTEYNPSATDCIAENDNKHTGAICDSEKSIYWYINQLKSSECELTIDKYHLEQSNGDIMGDMSLVLCRLGDDMVGQLVHWIQKLPFYKSMHITEHTSTLTSKWHQILLLITSINYVKKMEQKNTWQGLLLTHLKNQLWTDNESAIEVIEKMVETVDVINSMRITNQEYLLLKVVLLLSPRTNLGMYMYML